MLAISGSRGDRIATPSTCSYTCMSFAIKLEKLVFGGESQKKFNEFELGYFQFMCLVEPVIGEGFLSRYLDGFLKLVARL